MKSNQIKPLFDQVLIQPSTQEEKTASGIVLPDSAKEKPQVGTVVSVGPGVQAEDGKKIPMVVKKGQKVIYKKWGGNEVKVEDQEWLLVEQKDILAIVS